MQVLNQHIQRMIDMRNQLKAELKEMAPSVRRDKIDQIQRDIKNYVNTDWSQMHELSKDQE